MQKILKSKMIIFASIHDIYFKFTFKKKFVNSSLFVKIFKKTKRKDKENLCLGHSRVSSLWSLRTDGKSKIVILENCYNQQFQSCIFILKFDAYHSLHFFALFIYVFQISALSFKDVIFTQKYIDIFGLKMPFIHFFQKMSNVGLL